MFMFDYVMINNALIISTVLEFVGPSYRTWYGTGLGLVFSLGYCTVTGVGYVIRDDRIFQLSTAIPNIAFIGYIW